MFSFSSRIAKAGVLVPYLVRTVGPEKQSTLHYFSSQIYPDLSNLEYYMDFSQSLKLTILLAALLVN